MTGGAGSPAAAKRIAFFLPTLGGGGAERNAVLLSRHFADCGLQVDLVVGSARGEFRDRVDPRVRVVDLGAPRVWRSLRALVGYLRRERPDVLFSSIDHANVLSIVARVLARTRTRLVVSTHGSIRDYARSSRRSLDRWMPFLVRRLYPRADLVVTVSEHLARELRELSPASEIVVIPNPVAVSPTGDAVADAAREFVEGSGAPLIIGVGRLEREKGFDVLLRAFARASRRLPHRLLILGEGRERSRLEALVRELDLDDRVGLPGFVDEPQGVIQRAELLVVPSRSEGFGNVLVEALACGTPVVATDSGGPAEILADGRWGRLVPPEDEGALADAIVEALSETPDAEALKNRAGEFAIGKIGDRYREVLLPSRSIRRILYLIPEDWYVCSHRLPLLRAAAEAGHEVTVVTRVAEHAAPIAATGARVIHARLQRGFQNPFSDFAGLVNLIRIYRRVRPDLVHHVTPKSVLFGSLAAWLTRVPHVVNALAGLGFLFASSGLAAKIVRPLVVGAFRFLLGRSNSRLIVQNRDDERYFREDLGVPADRIRLIRGAGVNPDEFAPAEQEPGPPYRACLVGRLLVDKGIAETAEAARRIRARRDDIEIVVAGEPDPANPSGIPVEQIESWRQEGAARWLGRVEDVAGLLRTCHIGLLPSYREGLPKSLLEAAACGLALVATDVPGCREVCLDGENGLLIPARDPQAIADAVVKLVEDPELRRRYGQRSRDLILTELGEKQVVDATLALYGELLS